MLPKEKARTKKKNPPRLMDLPQRLLPAERADAVKGGQDLQTYREQLRNLLINTPTVRSLPEKDRHSFADETPKDP